MTAPGDVVAVVVTYRPRREPLLRLLDALGCAVAHTVVVDNGTDAAVPEWLAARGRAHETLIAFGENRGIAAAHNAGIARAAAAGARYVALFDQDSEPEGGMVARLRDAAERLLQAGHRVAAVGPRFVDARQPSLPPFAGVPREGPAAGTVEVDFVIASGALIPLATLHAVGRMNESLFIDYVDVEWGWRARHLGYRAFGVPAAVLRHALGEAPVEFLGRRFPTHAPLRDYYRFRNAVWLYRQPFVPRAWKRADAWRLVKRMALVALRVKPRPVRLRLMLRGIADGWRGRLGRFEAAQR